MGRQGSLLDDIDLETFDEMKVSEYKRKSNWIVCALCAATLFTICNVSIDIVSTKGMAGILYFSPGIVFSGLVYFSYSSILQRKAGNHAWVNWNLVVDGKLNRHNVFFLFLFSMIYLLIKVLAILTFYLYNLAKVNPGVITTIWSVGPLLNAVADYWLYGQKLTVYHAQGMLGMILALFFISFSRIVSVEPVGVYDLEDRSMPAYIPALTACILPILFAASAMTVKHCTLHRGFDPDTLSFGSYLLVCAPLSLIGVAYWLTVEFDSSVFFIGFVGAIINNVGIVMLNRAYSSGPSGPSNALSCASAIGLTAIVALINRTMPSDFELYGLLVGTLGILLITIPEYFERLCCSYSLH